MGSKTLIALIGPSAVGKSTIAREIIRLGGPDFSEAYSSVTRPRRSDDPAGYQTADEGFTISHAKELIAERAVTNYSIHPSGNIYATLPQNFPAVYNLLPLLPSSLDTMRRAGCKSVISAYITTSVEAFAAQLATRADDPSFGARLREGQESLDWAVTHQDELTFIENTHGDPRSAAKAIISLITVPQPDTEKKSGILQAHAMLEYLEKLSDDILQV